MAIKPSVLPETEPDFSDLASLSVIRKDATVEVFTNGRSRESDWKALCNRLLPTGLRVSGEFLEEDWLVFVWE